MFIRAYLRASTKEQDANRARASLEEFAETKKLSIASFYTENESGRKLQRPELSRLINDAQENDIILIESIDRLTRLTQKDWQTLKLTIEQKRLKIVAIDLPTSHMVLNSEVGDPTTQGIMTAVNCMLIDILATMASKDYETRRQRCEQGIAKAKKEGRFTGRRENVERNNSIMEMLSKGMSYTSIQQVSGASRVTISKLKKRLVVLEEI